MADLPGSNVNNADLVRLIADGRIFLGKATSPRPTGIDWTPDEPWPQEVSSCAIDDGARLLLVDP